MIASKSTVHVVLVVVAFVVAAFACISASVRRWPSQREHQLPWAILEAEVAQVCPSAQRHSTRASPG